MLPTEDSIISADALHLVSDLKLYHLCLVSVTVMQLQEGSISCHSSGQTVHCAYRLGVARPFLMLKALFLTLP